MANTSGDRGESVRAIMTAVAERAPTLPAVGAEKRGTYAFHVTGTDDGDWHVCISGAEGDSFGVQRGAPREPARATISLTARDFERIMSREINAEMAYMAGKLEIEGDLGFALQFQNVLVPKKAVTS